MRGKYDPIKRATKASKAFSTAKAHYDAAAELHDHDINRRHDAIGEHFAHISDTYDVIEAEHRAIAEARIKAQAYREASAQIATLVVT